MFRIPAWAPVILLLLQACTPARVVLRGVPTPRVERHFAKTWHAPSPKAHWVVAPQTLPPPENWSGLPASRGQNIETFLRRHATTSFLVVRNDSILYEHYDHHTTANDPQLVFSITKSIMSMLVGKAIELGKLKGVHQQVREFIPEWANEPMGNIRLEHLLNMTSGLNHGDYEYPFKVGTLLHTQNMRAYVLKHARQRHEPGSFFRYKSIDTQVLGMCLEAALGEPVPQFLHTHFWQPMGMEGRLGWCLDAPDGQPKYYGGILATARDLARLGQLYLNGGRWEGKQLLPESWVQQSLKAEKGQWPGNHYCWWMFTPRHAITNDFFAGGYRGQTLYVDPVSRTIVVRLGLRDAHVRWSWALPELVRQLNSPPAPTAEPQWAQKWVGTYRSPDGRRAHIGLRNGQLYAKGNAHRKLRFKRWLQPQAPHLAASIRKGVLAVLESATAAPCQLVLETYDSTLRLVRDETAAGPFSK